jgi:hypothetical protein
MVLQAVICLVKSHNWHRVSADGVEMIECYRCHRREPRPEFQKFVNPH